MGDPPGRLVFEVILLEEKFAILRFHSFVRLLPAYYLTVVTMPGKTLRALVDRLLTMSTGRIMSADAGFEVLLRDLCEGETKFGISFDSPLVHDSRVKFLRQVVEEKQFIKHTSGCYWRICRSCVLEPSYAAAWVFVDEDGNVVRALVQWLPFEGRGGERTKFDRPCIPQELFPVLNRHSACLNCSDGSCVDCQKTAIFGLLMVLGAMLASLPSMRLISFAES